MPIPRRATNLTLKEQGFVQSLVKTKHIRKSVEKNYNTKSRRNAAIMGTKLMNTPRVQYAILDLMDRSGLGDLKLVEKLKEHLYDARKEILTKDGEIVSVKDNNTQIKALDMAMKIKGAYAPERHEVVSTNINIYKDLSDEELNSRLALIEEREADIDSGKGKKTGA